MSTKKVEIIPIADKMRIKLLYMAEKKFSDISAITGYPVLKITSIVQGNRWAAERKTHRAQVVLASEVEIKMLEERKVRWFKSQVNNLEEFNEASINMVKDAALKKDPREFSTTIKTYSVINQMYRRTTGMDGDTGGRSNPLQVNLVFNQGFDPSENKVEVADAIDVEVDDVS
jgi:hypothetical protein